MKTYTTYTTAKGEMLVVANGVSHSDAWAAITAGWKAAR